MKRIEDTPEFEAFWAAYPRRVGKGAARKAFARALKVATVEEIMAGLSRYAKERAGQDHQFTCHPSTWLNQERWADEPPEKVKPLDRGQVIDLASWYEERGMHIPMRYRH